LNSITILPRKDHSFSREHISKAALKVLYRLRSNGYIACLVGGALRDRLRDREPRDFDLVTDASIPQIRKLFRNSRSIGRRFPIVHAYFGDELVEISSLKSDENQELDKYELIREDALRRDFTANALFYDIEDFQIIDPLNAIDDILEGRAVIIGDPLARFKEDPIRMLRALKLKVKSGFTLGEDLQDAIRQHRDLIQGMGSGRKYEEVTRLFLDSDVDKMLEQLQEFGLMRFFWPAGALLIEEKGPAFFKSIRETLQIQLSRGSYAKLSHTTLWLRLFCESGVFDPQNNPAETSKVQFIRFIEPLGIPFKAPILEAIQAITLLHHQHGSHVPTMGVPSEVEKLLEYYITHCEPEMRQQLTALLKTNNEGTAKRKKRPSRGAGRRRGRRRPKQG
jgi:poly(A) polymerase